MILGITVHVTVVFKGWICAYGYVPLEQKVDPVRRASLPLCVACHKL